MLVFQRSQLAHGRNASQARRTKRFVPNPLTGLETRALLSVTRASAIVGSQAGSLPHEVVGTTSDVSIPGPKDGSTHEITVGPDGAFWITQETQDRVIKMTLDGKFTFFQMPAGSMPHGEEFDAKGHLWVGLEGFGQLIELDTTGTVLSTHTIPYSNTFGYSPTVDNHGLKVTRDGKIWYTGKASNTVGYYDPSTGQFAQFPLGNPNSTLFPEGNFPIYIDEAPDGSMMFTDLDTSSVGRLTPSTGALQFYNLPAAFGVSGNTEGARPIRIIVRDDGVAVVSEESGRAYAYITPQGAVTEYPLSPSTSEGAALTYDRAGVLWVQYNTPDAIAQVLPDGSVRPYPIPTLSATQHRITIGPDGALWFTELAVDKIGRMVNGNENGPPVGTVTSQKFQAQKGGVSYNAAFEQGITAYAAQTKQTVKGQGNEADRRLALSHFSWNLQGAINKIVSGKHQATFGVKLPPIQDPHIKTRFKIEKGRITFTQSETIGKATYHQTFTMKLGNAKHASNGVSNLSSATAHYLEALKVLSNAV